MIEKLTIKNFRGFEFIELPHLKRLNLITGKNNVGKTALLEALFLFLAANNPILSLTRLNRSRAPINLANRNIEDICGWLFHQCDLEKQIEIKVIDGQKLEHQVSLKIESLQEASIQPMQQESLTQQPNYGSALFSNKVLSTQYSNSLNNLLFNIKTKITEKGLELINLPMVPYVLFTADYPYQDPLASLVESTQIFSQLQNKGEKKKLIEALQIIDPRVQDMLVSFASLSPELMVDLGFKPIVPIAYLGDGANKLVTILLRIARAQGGIVLVDEIENGFHYSTMPKIWETIENFCTELNVQFFATTHSLECAHAVAKIPKKEDFFMLYRLHRLPQGEVKVGFYDRESLESAIRLDWELR